MWKVFLDIDGVLADFVGDSAEVFNESRRTLYNKWKTGNYAVWEFLGVPEREFWHRISMQGSRFWADMTRYPDSRNLLDSLLDMRRSGEIELYLTTAVSDIPLSYLGRIFWIRNVLGAGYKDYIFIKKKGLLGGKHRLLIDDFPEQCQAFKENGGRAVLFRRPWNTPKGECEKEPGFYTHLVKDIIRNGGERKQMELFSAD